MWGDSVYSENVKCEVWKSLLYNRIGSQRKTHKVQDLNFFKSLQNITTHFLSLNPVFYIIYFTSTTIHIVSLCLTDTILSDQTCSPVFRQFYFKVTSPVWWWTACRQRSGRTSARGSARSLVGRELYVFALTYFELWFEDAYARLIYANCKNSECSKP